jgi:hypothetical protein
VQELNLFVERHLLEDERGAGLRGEGCVHPGLRGLSCLLRPKKGGCKDCKETRCDFIPHGV